MHKKQIYISLYEVFLIIIMQYFKKDLQDYLA